MIGNTHRALGRVGLTVIAVTGLVAACTDDASPSREAGSGEASASSSTTTTTWAYPGDDWAHTDAADAGFDPAALDRLGDDAAAAGSSCLAITRDGKVVDERYWESATAETPREAFSVTKSVTSVLVGIAQDEGSLSLDEPAADYIPEWRGTDSAVVTIEDLLSNDSGRHWDLATDYSGMAIGAADKTAFSVALDQDTAPGKVWAYNNSAIQTLSTVLEASTGQDPLDFARTELFDPIGMSHSALTTDQASNALTYAGLQTTCLDLARFGYLMLRGGVWEGEQVVSGDYVEQAVGRSSTPLNAAYGYLWWLNREGPVASPLIATSGAGDGSIAEGKLVPGAPPDVFWALGFNNQIVTVIPSEGVVAVRMGAGPPADAPFGRAELTRGVLGALVES